MSTSQNGNSKRIELTGRMGLLRNGRSGMKKMMKMQETEMRTQRKMKNDRSWKDQMKKSSGIAA
jgi:hypothetical protein